MTFANDGSLRKVLSRWRRFERVKDEIFLAPDVARDRAVRLVENATRDRGLVMAPVGGLRLFTYLKRSKADPAALSVATAIRIPIAGPRNQVRYTEIDLEGP